MTAYDRLPPGCPTGQQPGWPACCGHMSEWWQPTSGLSAGQPTSTDNLHSGLVNFAERHLEAQPGHRFRISQANITQFASLCDDGKLRGPTFSRSCIFFARWHRAPAPHLQDCSSARGNAVAIFSPTSGSNAKMTRAKSSKGSSSIIQTAQLKQRHGGKVCHFEFSHISIGFHGGFE